MAYLNVNGTTLYVTHEIQTTAPTVVFLHDSLGCVALWRDFPQRLAAETGCGWLAYDRQGYGLSQPFTTQTRDKAYLEREADVLAALLTQMGLQNVILFGHSDGGSIALIAAAKYGHLVQAVLTEGAHIFVEDITLEGIRTAVQWYNTTDLPLRLAKYHGDKTPAVFEMWTQTWLKSSFKTWNIEAFLPQISCPVLAIQGIADEYGSPAQVEGIVQQTAGIAQAFMVPNSGHSPHKEAATAVLAAAADFIRSYKA